MVYIQKWISMLHFYLVIYLPRLNFSEDNTCSENLFYLWLSDPFLSCQGCQNLLNLLWLPNLLSSTQSVTSMSLTSTCTVICNSSFKRTQQPDTLSNTDPDDSWRLSYSPSRVQPWWTPKALVTVLVNLNGMLAHQGNSMSVQFHYMAYMSSLPDSLKIKLLLKVGIPRKGHVHRF